MDNPFLPFTIDELLADTFLPHTGQMAISKDDNTLLGMTTEGVLMVIPAPEGRVFSNMTDEEFETFCDIWTQSIHSL